MKKFSRKNGDMTLRSYASGDGSISFAWQRCNCRLPELVTESDVSEYLLESGMEKKWAGWGIINLGTEESPRIRLARDVFRPFHTSRRLTMDGKTYRYEEKGDRFVFYQKGKVVVSGDTALSLMFFLLNEEAICLNRV